MAFDTSVNETERIKYVNRSPASQVCGIKAIDLRSTGFPACPPTERQLGGVLPFVLRRVHLRGGFVFMFSECSLIHSKNIFALKS